MNGWEYMSKGPSNAIICDEKSNKKENSFRMKFLQPPILVYRGAYIPQFKINAPIFCCPLFSENYLNPKVRINKMDKQTYFQLQPKSFTINFKDTRSHISMDS